MEKTHAVYSTKTKIVRLIIWLFLALAAIITIFPVCYVIFGSFKDNKELLVGGSSILPSKWVFDNYVQAWKQANFATYTMNSVFLSLAVMLISLINASIISLVVFIYNFFMLGDRGITASVSLSLFAVVMFASIFGTLVPMTLDKMKIDPALATGPFITITNDIIGMMIYMFITSALA